MKTRYLNPTILGVNGVTATGTVESAVIDLSWAKAMTLLTDWSAQPTVQPYVVYLADDGTTELGAATLRASYQPVSGSTDGYTWAPAVGVFIRPDSGAVQLLGSPLPCGKVKFRFVFSIAAGT